jgi:hypothetical protein
MRWFDYVTVAKDAGIPQERLESLCALVRQEFPRDDMTYELHVLRACTAIRDGHITLDEALQEGVAVRQS